VNIARIFSARYLFFVVLLIVVISASPSYSQQSQQQDAPLDVQQVIDSGSKYADTVIVVKGCYRHDFEVSVLQPCEGGFDRRKYSVWVYDRGKIDFGALGKFTHLTPVTLKAEFEAGGKYGHLGAYKYSLLVHELLWHGEPKD
jgi:hypothetical protein